ncbi:dTDP-4-dehydrorhamnose reductase family protein [Oceanidesulfovibrio marinus]|uniref:dTDP-4-dehydrorhamnose reductase n=1 Tax=Oceanidesulfovibrio marinus TaxID=370038 RepID=A0ABX6NAM6_9BACT|nr:SDR family oxidoreductase [Oceanidesulfovibrio marinus]QJT07638.1 SDR family oxidoreductase [Oceanidesulfovibrio marinus]
MAVLVLGGAGMLGHQLVRALGESGDVCCTLHGSPEKYADCPEYVTRHAYFNVDVLDQSALQAVLDDCSPDAVVNCVGLVKQRDEASRPAAAITLNALFPHTLYEMCAERGARLIHMSTDCVFSGDKGMYVDNDLHDARDVYGRTKSLGEVGGPGALTLRTSIFGPELFTKRGLLEWFLAQSGAVHGYTRAIFSGFTTYEMSRIIIMLLKREGDASGVFNVSAAPISKYDLLCMIRDALALDIDIEPDNAVALDRSLDSSRFRSTFGYTPPAWREMISELATRLRAEKHPALKQ